MADQAIKWFLVIEMAIGFGPIALLLLVGVHISVFQLFDLISPAEARAHVEGPLEVIFFTAIGSAALVRFLELALDIANRRPLRRDRTISLVLMVLGLGVLSSLLLGSETFGWKAFFAIPLLVAIHFMYLGRHYLLGRTGGNQNDA